uniref:Uncharacterized protein n=1 Tax=Abalone asfa-like virus TaxID=2839893 RepID=A0A5K7Y7X2_9VIRU|nr:hypothetical protein [Abalone asfa-like virus]
MGPFVGFLLVYYIVEKILEYEIERQADRDAEEFLQRLENIIDRVDRISVIRL